MEAIGLRCQYKLAQDAMRNPYEQEPERVEVDREQERVDL